MPRPDAPDALLVARAASDDRPGASAALAELFRRHRPRLRSLALRLTRSEAEADDVVQDAFVAVLEKIGSFRGESAFGSWVYRVAANFALMRLRSPAARRARPLDEAPDPVEEAPLPDDRCDARRRLHAVASASARLRAPARRVIELRVVDGMDTVQVADLLGVSEDVVKVRLHRARVALLALVPHAA